MDIIEKFGNIVGNEALKDPDKARRLLLAGYRLQEKKLQLFPDRELPLSGQYAARLVIRLLAIRFLICSLLARQCVSVAILT